jgi:hypothetical protein
MLRLRVILLGALLVGVVQGFVPRGAAQEKKDAASAPAALQSATSPSATAPEAIPRMCRVWMRSLRLFMM